MKVVSSVFGNGRLRAAFFMSIALAWTAVATVLFLPPPGPASAQFVEQSTYGGTSTGSANAQVISIANLRGHTPGVVLRFIPGFTNTGPATLNDGFGAVAIVRPSSIGPVALSGQELWVGEFTCVSYNSAASAYQLGCNVDMTKIGATVEFRGPTAPRGTLIEDGSCIARITYAPLFSVIGTTYGACDGSTTFALPDSRGTMFAALDNQGANGAANRITTLSCSNPDLVGNHCGFNSNTLSTLNLPPYTPSGSVSTSISQNANSTGNGQNLPSGQPTSTVPALNGASISASSSFTGNPQGGSSAAFSILNPVLLGLRAIKY